MGFDYDYGVEAAGLNFGGTYLEDARDFTTRYSAEELLERFRKNSDGRDDWRGKSIADYDQNPQRLALDYDAKSDPADLYPTGARREVTSIEDYRDLQTRMQSIMNVRKIVDLSTDTQVIVGKALHEWVESNATSEEDERVEEVNPSIEKVRLLR